MRLKRYRIAWVTRTQPPKRGRGNWLYDFPRAINLCTGFSRDVVYFYPERASLLRALWELRPWK